MLGGNVLYEDKGGGVFIGISASAYLGVGGSFSIGINGSDLYESLKKIWFG